MGRCYTGKGLNECAYFLTLKGKKIFCAFHMREISRDKVKKGCLDFLPCIEEGEVVVAETPVKKSEKNTTKLVGGLW